MTSPRRAQQASRKIRDWFNHATGERRPACLKRAYRSMSEAESARRTLPFGKELHAYYCDVHTGIVHLGHPPPNAKRSRK